MKTRTNILAPKLWSFGLVPHFLETDLPSVLAVENCVAAAVDWLDVLVLDALVLDLVTGDELDTVLLLFVLDVSVLAVFVVAVVVLTGLAVLTVIVLTVVVLAVVVLAVLVSVALVVFVLGSLLAEYNASLVTSFPATIGLAGFVVEVDVVSEAVLPDAKLVMGDLVNSEHGDDSQYLVQVYFGHATSSPVRDLAS